MWNGWIGWEEMGGFAPETNSSFPPENGWSGIGSFPFWFSAHIFRE